VLLYQYHLTCIILIKTAFHVSVFKQAVNQCAGVVVLLHHARLTVEFLCQEMPDYISLDLWSPICLHLNAVGYKNLGLHAGAYKKLVRDMVQKQ